MNPKTPLPRPLKDDRNAHELSGEEARPAETHREQTRGGGHRSGSRGAGTFGNADGEDKRDPGPTGAGLAVHPA